MRKSVGLVGVLGCVWENLPDAEPVAKSDEEELEEHVDDAGHLDLGSRDLGPAHRDLEHRNLQPLAQVHQLHVKAPPSSLPSSTYLILVITIIIINSEINMMELYRFNLMFVNSFRAAVRVNILNPHCFDRES